MKRDIKPKKKPFKRAYIKTLLWVVGRGIQAVSKVDKSVQEELKDLPNGTKFSIEVMPNGAKFIVEKTPNNRLKFLGLKKGEADFTVKFKNIETAMLVLTFREATSRALANDRFVPDGPLSLACLFVRILNLTEIYLLPKFIAKKAVKRYKSPKFKHIRRVRIYTRLIIGI